MLPEGWKRTTFGEVTTVASGQVDPTKEPFIDMLHIGPEDIESNTGRILEPSTCRELGLISGKYEFDEHAVVYSKIRPHLNKVCFPGFKGLCSADAYPIWPDEKQLNAEYLALYMLGPIFEKRAVACSMRTGMPKINREDLQSIPILIPPLPLQREITEVIKVWDAAIATTEKLLANSRDYWLALIGELLMPVPVSTERQAGSFPPSVQSGIPKLPPTPTGWHKVALGAHLHEINRPVSLEPDTEYTLVTVRRSRGGVDKRKVLLGSEIKTPTQFFVAAGDFLISKRQIVHGACGIVPPELDGAVVSNEYAVLGSDGKIDPRFLRYLSETTYFQQTCFHSSIGVHVEKMLFRTEQWLKRPFNIPPLDEQRRIVEILDTARQQMALAEQQLALLKAEKCALMQQLLTGKRRVRLSATEAVSA